MNLDQYAAQSERLKPHTVDIGIPSNIKTDISKKAGDWASVYMNGHWYCYKPEQDRYRKGYYNLTTESGSHSVFFYFDISMFERIRRTISKLRDVYPDQNISKDLINKSLRDSTFQSTHVYY